MKLESKTELPGFTVMDKIMSKHKRRNAWTVKEYERLKRGFDNGKQLKLIAYEIGKTVTAVNKYISRAGIERNRKSKEPDSGRE